MRGEQGVFRWAQDFHCDDLKYCEKTIDVGLAINKMSRIEREIVP